MSKSSYRIYFTAHCTNEGIVHIHADIHSKTSYSADKLWVHSDGSSTVEYNKSINVKTLNRIKNWILDNHYTIYIEYLKMNSETRYKDK